MADTTPEVKDSSLMRMIFVNLPVKDLDATMAFWSALGFAFNADYTDESAACLVIEENIFAMLIVEDRFRGFINGEIADAEATTEVLNALTVQTRAEVDDLVARARSAGAKAWKPFVEHGPMYSGSFQDLDGHVWELMSMDAQ